MSKTPKRSVLWFVGWPFRFLLISVVRGYRKWISPMLPPSCRYHPSCSTYGLQAVETHGAAKGLALTSWRIVKCNPFTEGGLNPVPPKGKWRAEIDTSGNPRAGTSVCDDDGVDSKAVSIGGSAPLGDSVPSLGDSPRPVTESPASNESGTASLVRRERPVSSLVATGDASRRLPIGRLENSQVSSYSQSGA